VYASGFTKDMEQDLQKEVSAHSSLFLSYVVCECVYAIHALLFLQFHNCDASDDDSDEKSSEPVVNQDSDLDQNPDLDHNPDLGKDPELDQDSQDPNFDCITDTKVKLTENLSSNQRPFDITQNSDVESDSDSVSDEMEQFGPQNHLYQPHRDATRPSSIVEKKAMVPDLSIVRKQVKKTLTKNQKVRHKPPSRVGSGKVRKERSKKKQVSEYMF